MTKMWTTAGLEGWWKAYGWREIRRELHQGVEEVLLEHDDMEEEEEEL